MSYEGFEQHICKSGHLFAVPCDYSMDNNAVCPHCKAPSAWFNAVDDTNCDSWGIINDFNSLKLSNEIRKTCDLGHEHIIAHATYRIPTREEHMALRCFPEND